MRLITDADNTLWDTNSVYAKAQLALLEDIERVLGTSFDVADRLSYVRGVDQMIASDHAAGLRYPPRLLVQSLARPVLLEDEVVNTLEQTFVDALQKAVPLLRPGVEVGLRELKRLGISVSVLTEASASRTRRNIQLNGLTDLIDEVSSFKKTPEVFSAAKTDWGDAFFVGDQLDVDILMARNAGFRTIYFPSGFTPAWVESHDDVSDYRIESFDEIPALMLR